MIARIVLRLKLCRRIRIAHGRIEVDHAVIEPAGPDPFIESLSFRFPFWRPV
jgi:hypothetical protein